MPVLQWILVWCLLLSVLAGRTRVSAESTTALTPLSTELPSRTETGTEYDRETTEYVDAFPCAQSSVTYGLADICDQTAVCPLEDDEFLCGHANGPNPCFDSSEVKVNCTDSSEQCIALSAVCDGAATCADESDEHFCERVTCSSLCSTCSAVGAVCDVRAEPDSVKLTLPATIRYLNLTGFSNLEWGLPISLRDLPLLTTLLLADNNITSVGEDTFKNMTSLRKLVLERNLIDRIHSYTFTGQESLTALALSNNQITGVDADIFVHLVSLQHLDLSHNRLAALVSQGFYGLWKLQYLNLAYNVIGWLEDAAFEGLHDLKILYLDNNLIRVLHKELFYDLHNLTWLGLSNNHIQRLSEGTFEYLSSLTDLILRFNEISVIESEAFRGLTKITGISFTDNNIEELRVGMLIGLCNVEWVSFRRNPLSYIESGTFDNTTRITILLIEDAHLRNLEADMFRGIENLQRLSTDDYRLCCLFDSVEVCTASTQNSLDSCSRLMPNDVLRYSLWILGSSALIGNSMVLFLRWLSRRRKRVAKEQPFFISNLAVADWMMGVFMIIIASADLYYGEYYYLDAPHWRASPICKFASFVATLSSESSVFMLTIITIDRYLTVLYPFSDVRFTRRSARVCIGIMWFISTTLALAPVVVGSFVDGVYGLSDVCIGLPLTVDSTATGRLVWDNVLAISVFVENNDGYLQPSWIYSIVLFLGVNLFCFLVILICYIRIFIQVRRMAKEISSAPGRADLARTQEVKIAIRMALIIGTDFFCWMPIIIMGLLSQTGLVELPVSLYAWATVFILPINASLNPYLYTFTDFLANRKKTQTLTKSNNTTNTAGNNTSAMENTKL